MSIIDKIGDFFEKNDERFDAWNKRLPTSTKIFFLGLFILGLIILSGYQSWLYGQTEPIKHNVVLMPCIYMAIGWTLQFILSIFYDD